MEPTPSLLLKYLNEKKKKNAQFSLRSLAKVVDISPSQLSSVINKRKKLSPRLAIKIIRRLSLSEQESFELLSDIHPELKEVMSYKADLRELTADEFELISDWTHFAILSLSYFKECRANIRWISKKLDISEVLVEPAFRRLERLGLLSIQGLRFVQTSKPLTTTKDIPSQAIRSHHRQNLQKAVEKLESTAIEHREYSSITFPIQVADLPKAKAMINEFKQKLYNELKCDDPSDVYTFSMQLFPLTNPGAVEVLE